MKTLPTLLGLALLCAAGAAQASDNCTISLDGNDRMQFDKKSVTVSAGCRTVTVELKHSGALPATAMGHNVVITAAGDVAAVAQAGIAAGAAGKYVPANDQRVIAHTDVIGGGATTRVTFPGNRLRAGGDYAFFCSFPGHSAIMRGTLVVAP